MKRIVLAVLATAVLAVTPLLAQDVPTGKFAIVKLDPAMDRIISANAKLDTVKGDYFGFAEGPLWVRNGGFLLFSDIAANTIYTWTPGGQVTPFLQHAGFTGKDASQVGAEMPNGRLEVILIGSNGLTLDRQGRLIICAEGDRTMVRVEKDGTRTTLADRYEGKRLNGPNDVVVKSDGAIYFSDQNSGLRGRDASPAKELPFHAVFMIKDGKLVAVAKDPLGVDPNGLAFSPDEKVLYVNGVAPGPKRMVVRFDVQPDDSLSEPKLFIDMSDDAAFGVPDGMKVDRNGIVYQSGPGGIWIISPDGKHLGTIRTPDPVTNLAFGDPDAKGLYITVRRSIYHVRLNTPGILP